MTTKPDAIQEQLIAARRNQILDAAVLVFAEKGFHRATIKDVAKAAGVADGTIYNYFENKTALILGLLNRLNESEERPEHFAQAAEMDSREFTRYYVQQRFETLSQGRDIFQVLLSEILVNKEYSYLKENVSLLGIEGENVIMKISFLIEYRKQMISIEEKDRIVVPFSDFKVENWGDGVRKIADIE